MNKPNLNANDLHLHEEGMMKKSMVLVCILALLMISSFACSKAEENKPQKPIIAVSIVPEETFVRAVCGDLWDIVVMVPPGYTPESHEPLPKDIEKFHQASLFFTIGVPVESSNLLDEAKKVPSMNVIPLHKKVAEFYSDKEFSPGQRDPHIWLSPKRVILMIQHISKVLMQQDQANAKLYQENALRYIGELASLDKEIQTILNPVENKSFIVFHPAFAYFASDYSLTMYSLEEEGKEANPNHMINMIQLAKEQGIKAIFYQEEHASQQAQVFANEINGTAVSLAPLSPDYIPNLRLMAQTIADASK
mgnify:CR=1 FL=1